MNAQVEIASVIQRYFSGIYTGDVELLSSAFHPGAVLRGEVRGQVSERTLPDYLEAVRARRSPESLGEALDMESLSVEVHGAIALVKTRCRMLGFDYLDFLSLLRIQERWGITAKVFTHLGE